MRVYHPTSKRNHNVFICPANDPRAKAAGIDSEWLHEDGSPRSFEICFVAGRADVSDATGRYLVATRQAKRTFLFLPEFIPGALGGAYA